MELMSDIDIRFKAFLLQKLFAGSFAWRKQRLQAQKIILSPHN